MQLDVHLMKNPYMGLYCDCDMLENVNLYQSSLNREHRTSASVWEGAVQTHQRTRFACQAPVDTRWPRTGEQGKPGIGRHEHLHEFGEHEGMEGHDPNLHKLQSRRTVVHMSVNVFPGRETMCSIKLQKCAPFSRKDSMYTTVQYCIRGALT